MAQTTPLSTQELAPSWSELVGIQDPRKKLLLAQALQGTDTSPVGHWTQGAARMANAFLGNYDIGKMDAEQKAGEENAKKWALNNPELVKALGGKVPSTAPVETNGDRLLGKIASLFGGGGNASVTEQPMGGQPPMGGVIGQPQQSAGEPQPPPPPMGRPSPLPPPGPLAAPQTPFQDRLAGVQDAISSGQFDPQGGNATLFNPRPGSNKMVAALGSPPPVASSGDPARDAAYAIGKPQLAQAMRAQPQPPPLAPGPPLPPDLGAPSPAPVSPPVPAPGTSTPVPPAGMGAGSRTSGALDPAMAAHLAQGLGNSSTVKQATQELNRLTAPKEQELPLTDPAERARRGIGPTDVTPYQINSVTGKVSPINPQPFQVNNNLKQESAFSSKAGELTAERFTKHVEAGQSARQLGSDIQSLRDLGTLVTTGKLAELKLAVGPYAQMLGVDIKDLGPIQAYESIIQRMAPGLRVPGVGAQSNYELGNFIKSLPNLGTSPEGNALISRVTEGMTQTRLMAADISSRALNHEISTSDADRQLRNLPDPLKEWREAVRKSPDLVKHPTAASGGSGTTSSGVKWSIQ